jgi:hypothetical protein
MKTIQKCPTCGTDCHIEWSGLELVENTGDETLATKTYKPINGFMKQSSRIAELEEALKISFSEEDMRRAFSLGQAHGINYQGKNFDRWLESKKLEKAKQLLNK